MRKTLIILSALFAAPCVLSATVQGFNGLYQDAKCSGSSIIVFSNTNQWIALPCKEGEKCVKMGNEVLCRPDSKDASASGKQKFSTVTITITDSPSQTSSQDTSASQAPPQSLPHEPSAPPAQQSSQDHSPCSLSQNAEIKTSAPENSQTNLPNTSDQGILIEYQDRTGTRTIDVSQLSNGQNLQSSCSNASAQNATDGASSATSQTSSPDGTFHPSNQPHTPSPAPSGPSNPPEPSTGHSSPQEKPSWNTPAHDASGSAIHPQEIPNSSIITSSHAAPSSSPSGGGKLSLTLLKQAVTECGYSSGFKTDFAQELVDQINKTSWDSNQTAMFLANIFHESGGLSLLVEQACASSPCAQYDNADGKNGPVKAAPGKHYFGRGYMQLSWPGNYKDASTGIYKSDKIYQNPDLVASDKSAAASTSIWFWNTRVMTSQAPLKQFGLTIKAINGAIECGKGPNPQAQKRWANYQKIAKILSVKQLASESGCYN